MYVMLCMYSLIPTVVLPPLTIDQIRSCVRHTLITALCSPRIQRFACRAFRTAFCSWGNCFDLMTTRNQCWRGFSFHELQILVGGDTIYSALFVFSSHKGENEMHMSSMVQKASMHWPRKTSTNQTVCILQYFSFNNLQKWSRLNFQFIVKVHMNIGSLVT